MAVATIPVRGNIRLGYDGPDDTKWSYTISRLNPDADADSLALLAEAANDLQGVVLLDIRNSAEYQLIYTED